MRIKTTIEFSRVPKGTTGTAEKDPAYFNNWKVTWDGIETFRGMPFKKRPLEDWFNQEEFDKYLVVI